MSGETWTQVYDRLAKLIQEHRTTLIFVNTRRLAERLTHQLAEKLGEGQIDDTSRLASPPRSDCRPSEKLKSGELKAVVATASLELGIDIGYIDLVVQIGSPRSIATFLQRIGRSGHSLGLTPKGRLFALTRDESGSNRRASSQRSGARHAGQRQPFRERRSTCSPSRSLLRSAAQDWPEVDDLFALVRRADPSAIWPATILIASIEYLSEGIATRDGPRTRHPHHDHVGKRIKARKCAAAWPRSPATRRHDSRHWLVSSDRGAGRTRWSAR